MERPYKVILLGQKNVGKSSLVHRLRCNNFRDSTEATIGVAFVSHKIACEGKQITLNIWDTAGQERFSNFLPIYIHNSRIALVCFELPKLKKVEEYVQIVRSIDSNMPIILVATKIDLYGIPLAINNTQLVHPEIEKYADREGLKLFYTSSLTGQNVQELFSYVANTVTNGIYELDEPMLDLNLQTSQKSNCC